MSLLKSRFIEMFENKTYKKVEGRNLFKFSSGKFLPLAKRMTSGIPVYGGNGISWYTDETLVSFDTIVIGRVGAYCGNVMLVKGDKWITDNAIYISEFKTKDLKLEFLEKLMESYDFHSFSDSSAQPKITQRPLENQLYIVPPIELQEEYINQIKQIDKSKFLLQQILEKFELLKKSRFIEMFGNVATNNKRWEKTKLGNKSVIGSSKRIFANEYTTEGIPFYRSKEIIELGMGEKPSVELYISKKRYQEIKEKFGIPIPGDILMTAVGTIGKFWIVPNSKPFYYKDGNLVYIRTKEFNPLFLKKLLEMLIEKYKVENANGSAYTALTIEKLKDLQIVLPPMTLQKQYEEFHIQIDKSKLIIQKALEDLVGKV